MTITIAPGSCIPGHASGSKPWIVPVPGNHERAVPQYLVRHGSEHLAAGGEVTGEAPWLHWMTIEQAYAAIAAHEARIVEAVSD